MAIPMENWGRDHMTTLLYLETRAVDARGVVGLDQMRCNPARHPGLVGPISSRCAVAVGKNPTRLRGGVEVAGHDDWDCFNDLQDEGLVIWTGTGTNPVVIVTPAGFALVSRLRQHRAAGKKIEEFIP